MPAFERNSSPRGVKFYDLDGKTMFLNVIDGTTRFGPRLATEEDMAEFPKAWVQYETDAADERAKFTPPVTFTDPDGGPPVGEPLKGRTAKEREAV